jgi:hypothetical protein
MNQRVANREAYWRASQILRSILDGGWSACDDERYTEADGEKIDAGMQRIVDILESRGWESVESRLTPVQHIDTIDRP